jgi:hypothetical protein
VRRRFDPRPGENFNPGDFLADHGTLYLLAQADDPASRLLQCLVADITCTAKDLADHSPWSRLDPPLTLVLDEIANWAPLPALPTYVPAYGGSGVVTIAVIQSRAQMARSWGSDAAKAIWDSATITGILGGVTDAENLRDFAAIAGDRDETSWQASTGKDEGPLGLGSGRSYSEQTRTRAVLTTGEIRHGSPGNVAGSANTGNAPTNTPYASSAVSLPSTCTTRPRQTSATKTTSRLSPSVVVTTIGSTQLGRRRRTCGGLGDEPQPWPS